MSDSSTQMEKFLSSGAMSYPCGNVANAKELLRSVDILKDIPVATRLKALQSALQKSNHTVKSQSHNR